MTGSVTAYTSDKAQEIANTVVTAASVAGNGHLILTTAGGMKIDAGDVVPTPYTQDQSLVSIGSFDFASEEHVVLKWTPTPTTAANTILPSPSALPSYVAAGVSWSPDSFYVACAATSNPPYANFYKRAGDVFTKLASPASLPTAGCNWSAWSPDGVYVAFAGSASPFIHLYSRAGDVFTKLANPATLPTSAASSVAWSPDGTLLAVATSSTPFIHIYQKLGTTFTKLADPATLPGAAVKSVAWSPCGRYLSLGFAITPFMLTYKLSANTTLTALANPSTIPNGTVNELMWTADWKYLLVAGSVAPYVAVYSRSGDVLTKLADPASPAANAAAGIAVSPDANYVMTFHAGPSGAVLWTFDRTTGVLTKIPPGSGGDTTSYPPDLNNGKWSPTGTHLVYGYAFNSPYIGMIKGYERPIALNVSSIPILKTP